MKKNFIMWILTLVVAFLGVVFAVVSFLKNKNFFRCFKNNDDYDGFEGSEENEEFDDDMVDEVKNFDDEIDDVGNCDVSEKTSEKVDSFDYVDLDDDGEDEIDYDVN